MREPTVIIETENGPVIINKKDYNPETHKLAGEILPPPNNTNNSQPEANAAGAGASNDETGNDGQTDGNGNDDGSGEAVGNEGNSNQQPVSMIVMARGKRFFVTDPKGADITHDAVNPKGYKTEAEAWGAVAAATVPTH